MNIYRTEFFATCPANGVRIHYALTIESESMVRVEAILAALPADGYHEDIADALVRSLGGRQTLAADHHSVHITTTRGGEE